MNGWMIGQTVILVSKLGGVFVFPKATCQLCWTGVQCPNASFLDSIQCAAILHAQTVQRPCCNKQTNKQTNGCTWVDENPQAFLSFFLSPFVLACLLQDTKHPLTNFAGVSVVVASCSKPSSPASQPRVQNWRFIFATHGS